MRGDKLDAETLFVIPAKAGIHLPASHMVMRLEMDSRLRGNDGN